MVMKLLLAAAALFGVLATTTTGVDATVFFKETFNDGDNMWAKRWKKSTWKKGKGAKPFTTGVGTLYGNKKLDVGLHTTDDMSFYATSAKLTKPFENIKKPKDFILQFSIRHPQYIECGGGSLKLFPPGTDQTKVGADTPFVLQFGPDICGTQTRDLLVSFTHKGKTIKRRDPIRANTDHLTHFYTLIVRPDASYTVQMDGTDRVRGSLLDDWDWVEPPTINDPKQKKPLTWVDQQRMHDPEDVQPETWDEAVDGVFVPRVIDNPAYIGEWQHPQIKNPKYVAKAYNDKNKHKGVGQLAVGFVGTEVWQVKAGSVFDNILITDDLAAAVTMRETMFPEASREAELEMWKSQEAAREKELLATRKRVTEERAKQDAAMAELEKEKAAAKAKAAKSAGKDDL
jgi:calreticulin